MIGTLHAVYALDVRIYFIVIRYKFFVMIRTSSQKKFEKSKVLEILQYTNVLITVQYRIAVKFELILVSS